MDMNEEKEGLVVKELNENNDDVDTSLRPQRLSEYIGQEDIRKSLNISILAAKKRNETIDHILFYGPPGLDRKSVV